MELGVLAPELAGPFGAVALLHLDVTHRQRAPRRAHRPESTAARFGRAQQLEVDLDAVDLLHAADVRVPELLERVHERTRALDARGGVDDLVAVRSEERRVGKECRSRWS